MRFFQIQNERSGALLGQRIELAEGWWSRAVGLLGRSELLRGHGILLIPCTSIHTVGMRFTVDIAFLDVGCRVTKTRANLPPGRFARGGGDVQATLELPVGTLAATDTREGDVLTFEETVR